MSVSSHRGMINSKYQQPARRGNKANPFLEVGEYHVGDHQRSVQRSVMPVRILSCYDP